MKRGKQKPMVTTDVIRWEDAAQEVTVTGWMCKKCRRWCGYGEKGEHMARYCCCTDHPCQTPNCDGRCEKGWTACPRCRAQKDHERWMSLERVDWDGKTPICLWDDARYFFDEDDLYDYMNENEIAPEDIRLVLCEPDNGRYFDMGEFLCDSLPEDADELDAADVEKIVNDWIVAHAPFSWCGGKKAISLESVRAVFEANPAVPQEAQAKAAILTEAADEIERLQGVLQRTVDALERHGQHHSRVCRRDKKTGEWVCFCGFEKDFVAARQALAAPSAARSTAVLHPARARSRTAERRVSGESKKDPDS